MAQKILLVDDEPAILGILGNIFTDEGYQVIRARDGESGLERVKKFMPDLIILDAMLPGINGFEVCKRLKDDDKTKQIRIIILTGILTLAEHKKRAFAIGADDYLTKPFDMVDLISRVKALINPSTQQ